MEGCDDVLVRACGEGQGARAERVCLEGFDAVVDYGVRVEVLVCLLVAVLELIVLVCSSREDLDSARLSDMHGFAKVWGARD